MVCMTYSKGKGLEHLVGGPKPVREICIARLKITEKSYYDFIHSGNVSNTTLWIKHLIVTFQISQPARHNEASKVNYDAHIAHVEMFGEEQIEKQ